jgi:DNA-directed RNA polymerase specialized sigma24 family protein
MTDTTQPPVVTGGVLTYWSRKRAEREAKRAAEEAIRLSETRARAIIIASWHIVEALENLPQPQQKMALLHALEALDEGDSVLRELKGE